MPAYNFGYAVKGLLYSSLSMLEDIFGDILKQKRHQDWMACPVHDILASVWTTFNGLFSKKLSFISQRRLHNHAFSLHLYPQVQQVPAFKPHISKQLSTSQKLSQLILHKYTFCYLHLSSLWMICLYYSLISFQKGWSHWTLCLLFGESFNDLFGEISWTQSELFRLFCRSDILHFKEVATGFL